MQGCQLQMQKGCQMQGYQLQMQMQKGCQMRRWEILIFETFMEMKAKERESEAVKVLQNRRKKQEN